MKPQSDHQTRRQRARQLTGVLAAAMTTLQCTLGMGFQLREALRGAEGIALALFILSGVAMALWSAWALLREDHPEWPVLVSNGIGAAMSVAICVAVLLNSGKATPHDPSLLAPPSTANTTSTATVSIANQIQRWRVVE